MTITHNHYHFYPNNQEKLLKRLLKNQKKIMASIAELTAKVDELQASLDAEQQQIQEAINGLNEQIATLTDMVADGGTAEERQALLDKLNAINEDLKGTVPDGEQPTA